MAAGAADASAYSSPSLPPVVHLSLVLSRSIRSFSCSFLQSLAKRFGHFCRCPYIRTVSANAALPARAAVGHKPLKWDSNLAHQAQSYS